MEQIETLFAWSEEMRMAICPEYCGPAGFGLVIVLGAGMVIVGVVMFFTLRSSGNTSS